LKTGTSVALGGVGGVAVIVRIGSLLTVAVVILIGSSWVRELAAPRDTQFSPTTLEMGFRSPFRDARGPDAIAMTSQSRGDRVDDGIDLYGNEVNAAVATYKLDRTGTLYELHSPQTEVPQLPPPKS
jgi:hypothetical protein